MQSLLTHRSTVHTPVGLNEDDDPLSGKAVNHFIFYDQYRHFDRNKSFKSSKFLKLLRRIIRLT